MQRIWRVRPRLSDKQLQESKHHPLLRQILANRGIEDPAEVDAFLEADYDKHIVDPFVFRDMQTAVQRIIQAIEKGERITVYGDYDVDGVTSISVLYLTFRALQVPNVDAYIPDRFTEGYGLNTAAVESIAKLGTTLIIACDCGTSNVNEIALAKSLGIDVIVVDHHKQPPVLPEPVAFLNPAIIDEPYPTKKLCSAGVAYKLVTALLRTMKYGKGRLDVPLPNGWEKWLLDIVAIATIADMMPLLGENRVFVKYGMQVLKKTRRPGLLALFEIMSTDLANASPSTIGFQVAPRLNAAGRLEHANTAFALLTTEDPAEAKRLAAELDHTNKRRQVLTERIFKEASAQAEQAADHILIVAANPEWSTGVVGLVAGRLKEAYQRPALAIGGEKGMLVGSGRSIDGFDITNALVESREHLSRFGGHPMACGFTLASPGSLEAFIDSMRSIANRELSGKDLTPVLHLDAHLPLRDVTWDVLELIDSCAPFGMAMPEPVLYAENVTVRDLKRVGKEGQHLRLRVADDSGKEHAAIGFRKGEFADSISVGSRIDVAFHIDANEWNGSRTLQLRLLDLKTHESTEKR